MPPEFSRITKLEDIGKTPLVLSLEATPEECDALAKRLEVKALKTFKAKVTLHWKDKVHLQFEADFTATVQQTCARTLDELTQHIEGHAEEIFTTKAPPPPTEEMDLETFLAQPEFLEEDVVDVGEILSQHLSLDLSPYVVHDESEPVEHVEEKRKSPFDKLKGLS